LYPKVCKVIVTSSICTLGSSLSVAITYLQDLFGILLLDVVRKELLLKVEPLAAALHALRVVINLEKEKYVMFVHLRFVAFNEGIDVSDDLVLLH
jgi:hypothetical protein